MTMLQCFFVLFTGLATSAMAESNLNLELLSLQDVPINNHASFICTVIGSLTVVKWTKDDVRIDLTDFHYEFTSDMSELDIDSVDATDAGSYQCIAQGADRKIYESNSKSIRVLARPTIHPTNATTFACKGLPVTLSCFGRDFTHVLWWFKGVEIQNQAGYQISGNTNERLVISTVTSSNAGHYTCKAINQYSSLTSSATQVLEVEYPPVILEGPRNGSFLEQYDIHLFCNVSAVPPAWIYWKKNGILVEELGKRYQVSYEEGALIIENAATSDAGKYACFANNSCTNTFVESKEAEIKVVDGEAVPFYSQDVYKTIPVGANAEIQCKANQSLQSETIVWSRNGKWLTSTKHLTLATNGQMIISQATYNLSNTYECKVRSRLLAPMARLFRRVVVTVKGPPDAPRLSLRGVKLENGRAIAKFNWTAPFDGNSRIIDFRLYYRSGDDGQWSSRVVDDSQHSATIALPNISTTTFFVRARNARNFSEKSNVVRVDVTDLTSLFFSLNTSLPGTISATASTTSGVFRTSTTAGMPAASLNRVIIAVCACLTILAAVLTIAVICGFQRKRVKQRLIQQKLKVHTSQSECSDSRPNKPNSATRCESCNTNFRNSKADNGMEIPRITTNPKAKNDDDLFAREAVHFSTVRSYSSSSCSQYGGEAQSNQTN